MPTIQDSKANRASRWALRMMCGSAGAVLLAGGAYAQTTAPAEAAAADQGGVGQVTIQAERRVENLQRVSLAATVLDNRQIKAKGILTVQDLQNDAPGLSIQPATSSETFINIRGVGIQQTNPASSNGVAFYVDGMYVPSLIDTVDTFYDLASVEVLRGPQGTLVGSNADGGAIFVNSAQPSFDRLKGYFEQTLGDYNDRRSEAAINVPLSDQLAFRAAFVYETRDSFTKNVGQQPPTGGVPAAQNQPGNLNYEAARLQLAWRPTSNFEVTLRYEPYESRTDGYAVKPDMAALGGGPGFDPYALSINNRPFLIDYNMPQYTNINGQRTSAIAVWNITHDVELRSVTSYQSGVFSDQDDIDASSAPINEYLVRRAGFSTFTQEFNLLSTSSSPFQWVVGAYYLYQHKPLALTFVHGPGGPLSVLAEQTTEAVFASGTYHFTPEWSLTLGGRYSSDDSPFHEFIFPAIGNFKTSDTEPSGTAKLSWQATPQTLVYASVSSGYKAGGVNLQIPIIGLTPPPFRPETNVVEELGLKTQFFDNHLRFDGDIFDSQYSNYQLQEATAAGFPLTQGPGKANIYGVEGEFTGSFGDLQFNLGVAYLNGTTAGAFPYTPPSGVTITIPSGTVIPYAPQWTLSSGIQYDFHIWNGTLTPRLQFQYQAEQFIAITHNVPGLNTDGKIPSHGTADFRLTYASPKNWTLEGYVTNFTNSTYISGANGLAFPGIAPQFAYGPPLQFGARASVRF